MAAPLTLPTDRYDDWLAWLPGFVAGVVTFGVYT